MGKGKWLTITEFAKLIGISRGCVHYAIQKGRLSFKRKGSVRMIDAEAGKKQWHASLDKKASAKRKKKNELEDSPYTSPPKVDQDGAVTQSEAERREKVYRSQLSELKYLEASGSLLRREEVERRAFECARRTRDAIMAIPGRLTHELAAETDPHKLENMLTKALSNALNILIKEGEKK